MRIEERVGRADQEDRTGLGQGRMDGGLVVGASEPTAAAAAIMPATVTTAAPPAATVCVNA